MAVQSGVLGPSAGTQLYISLLEAADRDLAGFGCCSVLPTAKGKRGKEKIWKICQRRAVHMFLQRMDSTTAKCIRHFSAFDA